MEVRSVRAQLLPGQLGGELALQRIIEINDLNEMGL